MHYAFKQDRLKDSLSLACQEGTPYIIVLTSRMVVIKTDTASLLGRNVWHSRQQSPSTEWFKISDQKPLGDLQHSRSYVTQGRPREEPYTRCTGTTGEIRLNKSESQLGSMFLIFRKIEPIITIKQIFSSTLPFLIVLGVWIFGCNILLQKHEMEFRRVLHVQSNIHRRPLLRSYGSCQRFQVQGRR